jgi:hypothetical protein
MPVDKKQKEEKQEAALPSGSVSIFFASPSVRGQKPCGANRVNKV